MRSLPTGSDVVTQRHSQKIDPCSELTVRERLNEVALERDLRQSTRGAYLRAMIQLGIADELVSAVTKELVIERAWGIANVNTRRNCLVASRTILGFNLRIPRGVPRRYNLPDQDTVRLVAMLSGKYEIRVLLMAFVGLRLGEAVAVTRDSISGRHLTIDRQVTGLRMPGERTVNRIEQTKGAENDVWCPPDLLARIASVTEKDKPDACREGIKRAFIKLGRPDLTCHSLRHFFATTALDRGAPMKLVSRSLRHSDISTTLRIYHQVEVDSMEAYWS